MLNQGLSVTGETKEYFIHGRIKDLVKTLPANFKISRILDFGCGIGDTTFILSQYFPDVEIIGTDLSNEALKYANEKYSTKSIKFVHLSNIPQNHFDLVYVNGVFHHIEPEKRIEAIRNIYNSLTSQGLFALFENNPWNIGSRIVMRRIKFDRDAKPLNYITTTTILKKGGFEEIICSRFLFYFPKALSILRFTEKFLVKIPLGAQYYVLARKKAH